jgi:hypothetical protein
MKNTVFLDVTPCGSCNNRRFGGTYRLDHGGEKISQLGTMLAVTSKCISALMREDKRSFETSVLK